MIIKQNSKISGYYQDSDRKTSNDQIDLNNALKVPGAKTISKPNMDSHYSVETRSLQPSMNSAAPSISIHALNPRFGS